mmetsp:Transcript_40682/g.100031  ORF Transcript_40682/g.100031 Transcript_40682/m.100031 type:complete len:200 (+) Transcript_40682:223-822(+)
MDSSCAMSARNSETRWLRTSSSRAANVAMLCLLDLGVQVDAGVYPAENGLPRDVLGVDGLLASANFVFSSVTSLTRLFRSTISSCALSSLERITSISSRRSSDSFNESTIASYSSSSVAFEASKSAAFSSRADTSNVNEATRSSISTRAFSFSATTRTCSSHFICAVSSSFSLSATMAACSLFEIDRARSSFRSSSLAD